MLHELRLTNFKAFGETVTIPIRPLTLIFGANSSGKSSIFQSLLLLKQTLEEAKNPETALLPKGSLVDLGTYSDFIHRHDAERNFEFGARFDLEDAEKLTRSTKKILEHTDMKNAGLSVQFSKENSTETLVHGLDIAIGDERRPIISSSPLTERKRERLKKEYREKEDQIIEELKERYSNVPEEDKESIVKLGRKYQKVLLYTKDPPKRKETIEKLFELFEREDKIVELREIYSKLGSELIELDYITINSELEFWHHWWNGVKSYIRHEFAGNWAHIYGKVDEGYDFEKLENYRFEDAIEDLREALRVSTFNYKNFLPESYSKGYEDRGNLYEGSPFYFGYYYFEHWDIISADDYTIDGLDISPLALCVCSAFHHFLEELMYLGPLRSQPERHYEYSGDISEYVGQKGEHLPSILFKNPHLLEKINSDLEQLGVRYSLKLSKLQHEDASPSNIFSLRLVDKRTGIDASIQDVGFGISQVLPIVVQNRLAEKKMLLVEQPEIHLHPAHQAELGDMFIRAALEKQRNTLLLETHSEHLILRILRRIRETTDNELPEGFPPIRPEDVAVLYVQPNEKGAQVIEIPVTEDGEFARPWPGGFFAERAKELF